MNPTGDCVPPMSTAFASELCWWTSRSRRAFGEDKCRVGSGPARHWPGSQDGPTVRIGDGGVVRSGHVSRS